MLTINGFSVLENTYVGTSVQMYRAIRLADNQKVILKIPLNERPSRETITALEHEYHLMKTLNLPNLIHTYNLIQQQLMPVLVLEDFIGGIPLNVLLKQKKVFSL